MYVLMYLFFPDIRWWKKKKEIKPAGGEEYNLMKVTEKKSLLISVVQLW